MQRNDPVLSCREREAVNAGAWFASLSSTLRHDILRSARVIRYADGDTIALRGEPATGWMACCRGALQVCAVAANGKAVTLDYVEPGQWLGAMDLLDGAPHLHEVCAHGDTTLLWVPRAAFLDILARHTELYGALLRQQAECTRRLYEQVEDLKTLGLRQRLARQLLELARKYGLPDGKGIRITLRLAQQELAQLLGASRQRINEQLKHMERQDTIRMDAGALVLCNVGALQRMGDMDD